MSTFIIVIVGFSGVTITSDGSVMPCRRIGLVAGNLREEPLRVIWARSKLLWRLRRRESYYGYVRPVPPLVLVPGLPGCRVCLFCRPREI